VPEGTAGAGIQKASPCSTRPKGLELAVLEALVHLDIDPAAEGCLSNRFRAGPIIHRTRVYPSAARLG